MAGLQVAHLPISLVRRAATVTARAAALAPRSLPGAPLIDVWAGYLAACPELGRR